jgi:CheY-like chemotaxis protein
VKADPDLRRIPVVVLTTSEAEEDIVRSYDLHANAYVRKPVDFHQFNGRRWADRGFLVHRRQTLARALRQTWAG